MLRLISNHMLNMDPPDHTRLRGLVNKAFTTSMVDQLETRMVEIADELIDKVADRGQMDLIHDYAFPLPVIVIAEMLGVPTRDRGRFRNWSHAIVTPTPNAERTAQKLAKSRQLMEDFIDYLRKISAHDAGNSPATICSPRCCWPRKPATASARMSCSAWCCC